MVLASGLIATNFMSLNLLARKDSGIPDIAKLSSTPYSSIQIRSETGADGAEEWSLPAVNTIQKQCFSMKLAKLLPLMVV